MIGDEYLQIRAQLGTTLFSLSTLAHGVHAGRDALQSLQELRANLRQPFLVVLLGETKSGKSSLINAFFGREIFSPTTPRATDKIHIFKYGLDEKSPNTDSRVTEYHHPNTLLRDFHIVDTPPTSAITMQQQAVVGRILPSADLALFVFSITNPWAPSAWEFLKTVRANPARNVIFVLQQCDLRDEFEVEAVWKHLEQNIHERYSPEARVFAVSAKKAFLSRTTGTDKEGLMQQSHFPALESYINDTVMQSEERVGTLRSVWHTARTIFAHVMERLEAAFYVLGKDAEKLTGMQQEIDEHREQSLRHVSGLLWTLAQSYERMQKRCDQILEERLSFAGILPFGRGSTEKKASEEADAELQESIHRQIRSSIGVLEDDLAVGLRDMHEFARKHLSASINVEHPPEFMEERAKLLEGIETAFVEKTSETQLQRRMRVFFDETSAWLRVPPEEDVEAVADALAKFIIDDFTTTMAEAVSSTGSVASLVRRGRIFSEFRAEMARKREEMLAILEPKWREAAMEFYREAAAVCQPLNHLYVIQRGIYDGRAANAKQMEENFSEVGAALGMPVSV